MTGERGLPTETASVDFSYYYMLSVNYDDYDEKIEKRKMVAVQGLEPRTQGL
jgi:hypothetical protein